jgi:hypothetical protein
MLLRWRRLRVQPGLRDIPGEDGSAGSGLADSER